MKRFAIALVMLAIEPAASQSITTTLSIGPSTCVSATIHADDTVSIDWSCVKIAAAEYHARRARDPGSAFAFVLEALRNGTARVK